MQENKERIIFHVDVNSAFLSWEAAYRCNILLEQVDIRDIAAVVGGDEKKRHGIVLAKSMLAKKYGIKTGESLAEARSKCPNLVVCPPHFELYKQCSKSFINLLKEYTPHVEQYSIDEAYMDMTGTISLHGGAVVTANAIKDRIYRELGFSVNVGVSNNKLLAKMASDFKKPNLVHTLFPSEIEKKMWPLDVSDLFFVGRATTKRLYTMGIRTIGDLAKSDLSILKLNLKKHGELIYNFANGIDESEVISQSPANKGYGNSTTMPADVADKTTIEMVLLSLAETVGARLRKDKVCIQVVAISLVDCEFHHFSRQMTLLEPTNVTNEIYKAACMLLDKLWGGEPLRGLGIHTSKVVQRGESRQITLFELGLEQRESTLRETSEYSVVDYHATDQKDHLLQREKLERVEQAVDQIRSRYGQDAVKRAKFINSRWKHMEGGQSSVTSPKERE